MSPAPRRRRCGAMQVHERLLETYVGFAPRGYQSFAMAIPLWLREKLFQKDIIRRELQAFAPDFDWPNKLLFTEHHMSHAASAFFASPFREAAVLTLDGVGEWCTTSSAVGRGNNLSILLNCNACDVLTPRVSKSCSKFAVSGKARIKTAGRIVFCCSEIKLKFEL